MENATTYREMLTPKNVYRFLTDNLPGLYPQGVIPAADRKGMTLVKFWSQVLEGVIPAQWQTSLFGGSQRSRRLSDLMNRTGGQPLPSRLEQEMNALLSGELLVRLTQQMLDFLRGVHYAPEALTRALPGFVKMMSENEEYWTLAHERVFRELAEADVPRTFRDGLTLAWLALLAFYGTEMGTQALLDFCRAPEHSARALYLLSSHVTFGRRVPLSMTGRNCELCRQGLSAEEYIIDEGSCLPQLEEAIRRGGKIAVTGMGGIGKTEMTRQALSALSGEELFSRLAWVQYDGSLTASFRAAFEGLDGVAEENVLQTVREQVEAPYQGRTLLLIDSIDVPPEADADLREIEQWGCDVLVTTRFPLGAGFHNIAVPLLSMASSRALFMRHDPYVQDMGGEEALTQLLQRVEGHPLAIILLARLAKMKRWTMETLLTELDRVSPEGLRLSGGKFSDIAQQIAQMVSTDALTDRERQVLAVFATFPDWTIPVRETLSLLRDFGTKDELTSALETAADYGLLTSTWRGYAMHPVLSESFRGLLPPIAAVPRLLEVFKTCKVNYAERDDGTIPLLPLALHAISEFADAPVEVIGGMIRAIHCVMTDECGKIPAARLKRWQMKKKDECERTQRGRFLNGCLSLELDEVSGGDLAKDSAEVMENLAGSCEDDVDIMEVICDTATQNGGEKNISRFLARMRELIPPNHPRAAEIRTEITSRAMMHMGSVPPEELEEAISYCVEALDDPKRVTNAAVTLLSLLYGMGLIEESRERIKELAELVEEKTKNLDLDNMPQAFYGGMECVFHDLGEYDKALFYAQRALERTEKNTHPYFATLYNYLQLKKEMGQLLETREIIVEALQKVQELFGKNNALYCGFKTAYIAMLMELKHGEEANDELERLLPLVRHLDGEIGAKEIEMIRIRALALMGREEEALKLGEQLRAFIIQIGGEEWQMMKRLEAVIDNVKAGAYRQET